MSVQTVNLVKDQKVDITKTNPGLTKVSIGLGWDTNAGTSGSFDLDAFVVTKDDADVIKEIVYFG